MHHLKLCLFSLKQPSYWICRHLHQNQGSAKMYTTWSIIIPLDGWVTILETVHMEGWELLKAFRNSWPIASSQVMADPRGSRSHLQITSGRPAINVATPQCCCKYFLTVCFPWMGVKISDCAWSQTSQAPSSHSNVWSQWTDRMALVSTVLSRMQNKSCLLTAGH